MKLHAHLLAYLVTIAALAAATGLLYLGRPTPPTSEKLMSLPDGKRLSRELDGRMASTRQLNEVKEAIIADVIAGRLSLFEAAAGFKVLAEEHPDFHWDMFRRLPGGSDDERHCRAVLRWVRKRLPEGFSQAEAILARREAELQAHLDQHGTVTLPPL